MALFDQLGGDAAMVAVVTAFYKKVENDERISHLFAHLDMSSQIDKHMAFMSWAFDGPSQYRNKPLGLAHRELVETQGLTRVHFDGLLELLGDTLRSRGTSEELIATVMSRLMPLCDQVLGSDDSSDSSDDSAS